MQRSYVSIKVELFVCEFCGRGHADEASMARFGCDRGIPQQILEVGDLVTATFSCHVEGDGMPTGNYRGQGRVTAVVPPPDQKLAPSFAREMHVADEQVTAFLDLRPIAHDWYVQVEPVDAGAGCSTPLGTWGKAYATTIPQHVALGRSLPASMKPRTEASAS